MVSKRFPMVPPDSSAARMPFPGATTALAVAISSAACGRWGRENHVGVCRESALKNKQTNKQTNSRERVAETSWQLRLLEQADGTRTYAHKECSSFSLLLYRGRERGLSPRRKKKKKTSDKLCSTSAVRKEQKLPLPRTSAPWELHNGCIVLRRSQAKGGYNPSDSACALVSVVSVGYRWKPKTSKAEPNGHPFCCTFPFPPPIFVQKRAWTIAGKPRLRAPFMAMWTPL
jgi:hypothetical protein